MAQTIQQIEDVQAEAERRGYIVATDTRYVRAVKRDALHVKQTFAWDTGLAILDPDEARSYVLLQAYCWIRGYDLDAGDDGKMELHRGMHHPAYQQQRRVAQTFDYFWDGGMDGVQHNMLQWIEHVEQSDYRPAHEAARSQGATHESA
jgi:hypothetical protein